MNRLCTALALAALFAPVSTPATAAPAPLIAQAIPDIDNFVVEAVDALTPGTELVFTLEGTPGAKATFTIVGIANNRPMREVRSGVYEGRYTIKRKDRFTASTVVRANLRQGNSVASTRLTQPLVATGTPDGGTAPTGTVPTGSVAIRRFSVDPVDRIEPGTELVFRLSGTPRATASFTIAGVVRNQAMEEVSEGTYEGHYTVRRQDNFPPGTAITASLQAGNRTATARLQGGLVNDTEGPSVQNLTPPEGTVVPPGRPLVSGLFEDGQGTGVDQRSVRIRFDGQDVTRQATVTANFFNYRPNRDLPPGEYRVEVDLKDAAGNPGRTVWSFLVQRGSQQAPGSPTTAVPLEVTSPANNSPVPAGPVTVRGRTAPGAVVAVKVMANTSLAGFFGVTQTLLDRTVQADSRGNFTFQFQPRLSAPGTRYEVDLSVERNGETREQRLFLVQQ